MFQQLKNIDTAFRAIRIFALCIVVGCFSICGLVIYQGYQLAKVSQEKVYVLANGQAIEAFASDRATNLVVEAKAHIQDFHRAFFNLSPDNAAIDATMAKALFLADASALAVYNNLEEQHYYAGLIAGNISQEIQMDSISLQTEQYPYPFTCYATQILTRPTAITRRRLVTSGQLRSIKRSRHNSHGFLIEHWQILSNADLETKPRKP